MTDKTVRQSTLCMIVLLAAAAQIVTASANKKRKPSAVIAGTVFQENGVSLRGAQVVVINKARPKKKLRGTTDLRGEFAIRVPAGQAQYLVTARAKGFEPQQKDVEIYGMEKVNINFLLSPK